MDIRQWEIAKQRRRDTLCACILVVVVALLMMISLTPHMYDMLKSARATHLVGTDKPIAIHYPTGSLTYAAYSIESSLPDLYSQFNAKYFSGTLPPTVLFECTSQFSNPPEVALADTRQLYDQEFKITFYQGVCQWDRFTEDLLLHEMTHIDTWGMELPEHGPIFDNDIRRLSREGAFADIWE